MASSTGCISDCGGTPQEGQNDPDITGIGVVIAYIVSAGIVVLILACNYVLSFRPEHDVFSEPDDESQTGPEVIFTPNPIDVFFLSNIRKLKVIRKYAITPETSSDRAGTQTRLQNALDKCVRAMSDIQILTGLSILISAYAQLNSCISCYHWQILVYLAWFSSLTHLACLTFSRRYLFSHKEERVWRLFAMGLIALLLTVASIPTGNFDWMHGGGSGPDPADYVVCHFGIEDISATKTRVAVAFSIVLILVGFLVRVILLHKYLSRSITRHYRNQVSSWLRSKLVWLWDKWKLDLDHPTVLKYFVYHPLLALFLTGRISLDIFSSMLLEVWWLLISYGYGVARLLSVLMYNGFPQTSVSFAEQTWSFGQIVAVLLLAAPLVTISEAFFSDQDSRGGTQCVFAKQRTTADKSEGTIHANAPLHEEADAESLQAASLPQDPSAVPLDSDVGQFDQDLPTAPSVDLYLQGEQLQGHPNYQYYKKPARFVRCAVILELLLIATWSLDFVVVLVSPEGPYYAILQMVRPQLGFPAAFAWIPFSFLLLMMHCLLWGLSAERLPPKIRQYCQSFYTGSLLSVAAMNGIGYVFSATGTIMLFALISLHWAIVVCRCCLYFMHCHRARRPSTSGQP